MSICIFFKLGLDLIIDTEEMLLVIDVNRILTRAIRVTDETGQLVIMKGNKPGYIVVMRIINDKYNYH